MQTATLILFVLLVIVALAFFAFWLQSLVKRNQLQAPTPYQALVGLITDFLDTLSIGSFAVTTALYRPFKTVKDEDLPGTLNVGHTLPTIAQALIFLKLVEVESVTLCTLIGASVVGAWFGARLVSRLDRWKVQLGMGCALLMACTLMFLQMTKRLPGGGDALELTGSALWIAIGCNLIIGALMTIGVGAYTPIMIMVSLMGMNPTAAFPIMMGSCAFLMPAASWQFIRSQRYDARAAIGLTVFGLIGVALAALVFASLNVDKVRWLVLLVALATAIMMIVAGTRRTPSPDPQTTSG